jgi:hypothetical protein
VRVKTLSDENIVPQEQQIARIGVDRIGTSVDDSMLFARVE